MPLVAGIAAWTWLESHGHGYGWAVLAGAAVLVVAFAAKD